MLRQCMMADDQLLSLLAMEFADDYGQEFFFRTNTMTVWHSHWRQYNFSSMLFSFFSLLETKFRATILYAQTQTKRLFLELSGDFFADFTDGSKASVEKLDS